MNQLSFIDIQTQEDLSLINNPEELIKKIEQSGCTNCARGDYRNKNNQLKITVSDGNPRADIWVVGKSPGLEDSQLGKPFSFGSGDKLRELLANYNLDPQEDAFWINPVFCPMEDNLTPKIAELSACSVYFKRLIELCKPKAFIAVGGTAFKALTDKSDKIDDVVGYANPFVSIYGAPVWAIYHTAYWFKPNVNTEEIKRKTNITLSAFQKSLVHQKPVNFNTKVSEKMHMSKSNVSQMSADILRKFRWPNRMGNDNK